MPGKRLSLRRRTPASAPEEGTSARLFRNTLANGVGRFASLTITLALTPFLIRALGDEAYGVFVLALTLTFLTGYGALADLGVEGATVRYVAAARSEGDKKRVDGIVSTALAFFTAVGMLFGPGLALLSGPLVDAFSVAPDLRSEATACFALVGAQLFFDLPSRAFFAVLEGAQRFTAWQAIEISRVVVQGALFVVVLIAGYGLVGLSAALVISSAGALVMSAVLARRTMPGLRVSPRVASRAALRELVTLGGGLFALRVMGTLFRQMDKAIIGIVLGVRLVTPYDVANKVHLGAGAVQAVTISALLPAAAFVRRKRDVLQDMYLRGSSYSVAASLPVIVAGFIFAAPLIGSWFGDRLEEQATTAARLFFALLAITGFHVVGVDILLALRKLRWPLAVSAGILVVNLGLSIVLVAPLGIEGVVIGTVVANGLAFPVWLVILLREFSVTLREWAERIVIPNIPGLAAQVATAPALLWAANRVDHIVGVAAIAIVSIALSLLAYLTIGLRREQRVVLVTTLRVAVGLRPST